MKLSQLLATVSLSLPLWLTSFPQPDAIALSPSLYSATTQQLAQADWREISSDRGKFVVSMPGDPKTSTKTDPKGTVNYSFTLPLDRELYVVNYFDFPENFSASDEQAQQLLDNLPASFAEGASAKVVGDRNIALNGHPGKEFAFELANEQAPPGIGRLYLVNRRLYLIVVMTPQTQNAQRFLESFRLLS